MSKIPKKPDVDTLILYKGLVETPEGQTITYETLTGLIKRDVQGPARYLLYAARKIALREDGVAFGAKKKEGLVRLNDSGKVNHGLSGLGRIRRQAKRSTTILTSVRNFEGLSDEEKVQHNTGLSLFGVLESSLRSKQIKKIEAAVSEAAMILPTGRTLEIFMA
jgi:hypothetical protein